MKQLIKSLPALLRAAGDSEEVTEAAVFAAWKHAAGEGLKEHALPAKIENRTLMVSVADAVWQKQLHLMRGQLLFRLNSLLGQPIVSRIEFVIEPMLRLTPAPPANSREQSIDNDVPLELWSAANAIQDKELRRSFLKAATASLRRRESKG
jgi:hypothetical protein